MSLDVRSELTRVVSRWNSDPVISTPAFVGAPETPVLIIVGVVPVTLSFTVIFAPLSATSVIELVASVETTAFTVTSLLAEFPA